MKKLIAMMSLMGLACSVSADYPSQTVVINPCGSQLIVGKVNDQNLFNNVTTITMRKDACTDNRIATISSVPARWSAPAPVVISYDNSCNSCPAPAPVCDPCAAPAPVCNPCGTF